MYFETKFSKKFTTLLKLQEPKGGKTKLDDKTDEFWMYTQVGTATEKQAFLILQPILMFNTLESNNSLDVPIQDHDIVLKDVTDVNDIRIDQEIVCWDDSNTIVTATFDTSKQTLDEFYSCKTNLKMTCDVSDTVEEENITEVLGDDDT